MELHPLISTAPFMNHEPLDCFPSHQSVVGLLRLTINTSVSLWLNKFSGENPEFILIKNAPQDTRQVSTVRLKKNVLV